MPFFFFLQDSCENQIWKHLQKPYVKCGKILHSVKYCDYVGHWKGESSIDRYGVLYR